MTAVVDVLITAYNAERTLPSALASVQSQSLADIRIVVVDDGSTDRTPDILAALARDDARIVVIRKANGGIVESVNIGLAHCTAEFVARFDADDLCYRDRLDVQYAFLREHPHCVAVSALADHIDEEGEAMHTRTEVHPLERADCAWIPAREPYLLQPLLMVRRAALDRVGGYRLLAVAEDSDLYWRLREVGALVNLDRVLGAYRWHAASVSSVSVVNGRRLAYWSQLAALSARRRLTGGPDLVFDGVRLRSVAQAVTLDDFCRVGAAGLDVDEMEWLQLAMSIKLLEIVWRRPYEVDREDCRFIARAVDRVGRSLSGEQRADVRRQLNGSAMRLLDQGRHVEAYRLAGSAIAGVALRAAVRRIVPRRMHDRLRSMRDRKPVARRDDR